MACSHSKGIAGWLLQLVASKTNPSSTNFSAKVQKDALRTSTSEELYSCAVGLKLFCGCVFMFSSARLIISWNSLAGTPIRNNFPQSAGMLAFQVPVTGDISWWLVCGILSLFLWWRSGCEQHPKLIHVLVVLMLLKFEVHLALFAMLVSCKLMDLKICSYVERMREYALGAFHWNNLDYLFLRMAVKPDISHVLKTYFLNVLKYFPVKQKSWVFTAAKCNPWKLN